MATPDQVPGIVLPANGLIAVWYQATWQESIVNAARAAIFLGANQVQGVGKVLTGTTGTSSAGLAALTAASASAGISTTLASCSAGVGSQSWTPTASSSGDVTTGQVVGGGPGPNVAFDVVSGLAVAATFGLCYMFAAAGTYTVSVQFKASSGSVTASSRKLWVQALSFA